MKHLLHGIRRLIVFITASTLLVMGLQHSVFGEGTKQVRPGHQDFNNYSPDNTITLTSASGTDAQTVCINTPITNITYSTTGATGATFSGLPAGVNGNWAANVVTISGTPTLSGNFNDTITLTGGCGLITKTGTIIVQSIVNAGTIALNQTIIAGAVPTPLYNIILGTGSGILTYEWHMSTDGGTTWSLIVGEILPGYAPPALSTTTLYQRHTVSTVNGVRCYSPWSYTVTITVNAEPYAGQVGYSQTICGGTVPAALVSIEAGHVNTPGATLSYLWEYSIDGGSTWLTAPGANTGEGYAPQALTVTTIFRRKAISTINGVSSYSSAYVTITVNPTPILPVIIVNNFVCNPTQVIFQGLSNPAYTYYLNYISGPLLPQNYIDTNTVLYFEVIPPPGIHVYSVTARDASGCETSQQITVTVHDRPHVTITPSCSSYDPGSGTYTGVVVVTGTLVNANFLPAQYGVVQYSTNGGLSWTSTNPLTITNVPPGTFTILARNSAQDSCYVQISSIILEQSILTNGVEICQGQPSQAMTAFSLCIQWLYQSFFNVCTNPSSFYNASSNQNSYVSGPLANYGSQMFQTPDDGIVIIKECPDNPNTTISIYRTPFDANQPGSNFILMRANLCPGGPGAVLNLLPNTNYTEVINNYGPTTPSVCTKVQFTANHKGAVAGKVGDVSWYYNTNLIASHTSSYDPVAAGFPLIPNTNTPGEWLFYVSCEGYPCSQPVSYIINPYPIGQAIGSSVNCSNDITNILLRSFDNLGRQISPYKVSYTWTSAVTSGTASGNSSCASVCDSVIRDHIINNTPDPAIIRYTITPKVGACAGLPFYFDLTIEPLPGFTVLPPLQTICPGALITPIVITNTNTVNGLSYSWTRTNTTILYPGIPANGSGSGSGFSISGNMPSTNPQTVQTTTFTIQALVYGHSCAQHMASVTVVDNVPPVISCPPKDIIDCSADTSAASNGTATAIDNCDPNPVISHTNSRIDSTCNNNYRIIRTWRAKDASGNISTCNQTIIVHDTVHPHFVMNPVLNYSYCVIDIQQATFYPDTMDITPVRPDYYILTSADKNAMYMEPDTYFQDNCTPPSNLILHWRLEFNGGIPGNIEGTGQFSNYPGMVMFPGSPTVDIDHHIFYWLEDSCGNISSPEVMVTITIKHRPVVIKLY